MPKNTRLQIVFLCLLVFVEQLNGLKSDTHLLWCHESQNADPQSQQIGKLLWWKTSIPPYSSCAIPVHIRTKVIRSGSSLTFRSNNFCNGSFLRLVIQTAHNVPNLTSFLVLMSIKKPIRLSRHGLWWKRLSAAYIASFPSSIPQCNSWPLIIWLLKMVIRVLHPSNIHQDVCE